MSIPRVGRTPVQTREPSLQTFSKNAFLGGLLAVANTGLSILSAMGSIGLLKALNKGYSPLGSPGEFILSGGTTLCFLLALRFPILYRFEKKVIPRLGCNANVLRLGGCVGAIAGLATFCLPFYRIAIQNGTPGSHLFFGAAFITGALVSGSLSLRKSFSKAT